MKFAFEQENSRSSHSDLFFLAAVAAVVVAVTVVEAVVATFNWLVVCTESLHAKTFSRTLLAATEASTLGTIMVSRMSRIFTDSVSWI